MRDFRGGEELRRAVWTLRNACAALNAFGGVHGAFLRHLRNRRVVRFGRAAGVDGDESAGGDDLVERTSIDDQIFDDRKRARAPRLDPDLVAVREVAHVQLTRGRSAERSMRDAV